MRTPGEIAYLAAALNTNNTMEVELIFTGIANLHPRKLAESETIHKPENYPIRKSLRKLLGILPPTSKSNSLRKCQDLAVQALKSKDQYSEGQMAETRRMIQARIGSGDARVTWIRKGEIRNSKKLQTPIGTFGICSRGGGVVLIAE